MLLLPIKLQHEISPTLNTEKLCILLKYTPAKTTLEKEIALVLIGEIAELTERLLARKVPVEVPLLRTTASEQLE